MSTKLCLVIFVSLAALVLADMGLEITSHLNYTIIKVNNPPYAQFAFRSGIFQMQYGAKYGRAWISAPTAIGWLSNENTTADPVTVYNVGNMNPRNMSFALDNSRDNIYFYRHRSLYVTPFSAVAGTDTPTILADDVARFTALTFDEPGDLMWAIGLSGTTTKVFWHRTGTSSVTRDLPDGSQCFSMFMGATNAYIGCTGSILITPKSNNAWSGSTFSPSLVDTRPLGAGAYISGVLDEQSNKLYLGAAIGLGIEIDLVTFSLQRIFFVSSGSGLSALRSAVLIKNPGGPTSQPVLYWGTSDGQVIRVNTRDFTKIFATASTPYGEDIPALTFTNGMLYAGGNWNRQVARMAAYKVSLTNCSAYDCASCFSVDREFCGVCLQTGSCTRNTECSGKWIQNGVCPAGVSLSPSRGSTGGGFNVTYIGTTFETGAGDHTCLWTQVGQPDVELPSVGPATPGAIVCQTPSTFVSGLAQLTIKYGARQWSSALDFQFYNCEQADTCQTCTNGSFSECGWCFRSGSCTSSNKCNSGAWEFQTSTCPNTISVTPLLVGSLQATPISVSVANFPATGTEFRCSFGGTSNSVATVASQSGGRASVLSCNSPALTLSAPQNFSVSITNTTGFVLSPTTAEIEIYNCSSFTRCATCQARPGCTWCGGAQKECIFTAAATCTDPAASTCPVVNSISPVSIQTGSSTSSAVTFTGTGFTNSVGSTCIWRNGATTLTAASTFVNSTSIQCTTPSAGLTDGTWQVSLGVGSASETNSVSFVAYTCSTAQQCSDCTNPLFTACTWCNDVAVLTCSNNPTSCPVNKRIAAAGSCPVSTSASPSSLLYDSGAGVNITGAHLLSEGTDITGMRCKYSATPAALVALTYLDANTVRCNTAPKLAAAATGTLQLVNSAGKAYSNALTFDLVDCETYTECGTCLSASSSCNWCGSSCNTTCEFQTQTRGCPIINRAVPNHADAAGGDSITLEGENFFELNSKKRASSYSCSWGSITTPAISLSESSIQCTTPTLSATVVELTVLLDGSPFAGPIPFTFVSCPTILEDRCSSTCTESQYCGWCVDGASCGTQAKCFNLWQSSCVTANLTSEASSLQGGITLKAALSDPIPNSVLPSQLSCNFGTKQTSATFTTVGNTSTVSCQVPSADAPTTTEFSVRYLGNKYVQPVPFTYADCAKIKSCSQCQRTSYCGWCSSGKKCTVQAECSSTWSTDSCPPNALAIGLGVGFGLFFLIAIIILIIFLVLNAKKKRGLIITLKEPNYAEIAFGTDTALAWRMPEHNYKLLDTALSRRDFILQLSIAFNCPPTEQDALAKALVYVASSHGLAAEMIQTCIRAEVAACKAENTLFRNNSVASKMYKFYSRIVGIKYLFNCIARVILELEVLGREQIAKQTSTNDAGRETSLLSVSMELDQTKAMDMEDWDTDTNLLQLQLICQKLLNVLIKTSVKNIPAPFRKIFVEIDNSIMAKFAGSNDAVYKGIGGLFFLRFVCPAITAPHVYGLLETPPNPTTQRQLVLISKVIQSIANMQAPGKKEQYMEALGDFIVNSIPKIIRFYDNLRQAVNVPSDGSSDEQVIEVPETVHQNGLAATWNFLFVEKDKIKKWSNTEDCPFDAAQKEDLVKIIDECAAEYTSAPKKIKANTETETGGKKKTKSKSKA